MMRRVSEAFLWLVFACLLLLAIMQVLVGAYFWYRILFGGL